MSDKTNSKLIPVESIFNFPFSTIMMFKCVSKKKFALGFQKGEIFLNHPSNWVKIEQDGNKGQGDLLEGTYFTTKTEDSSPFITQLKSDPSIEVIEQEDYSFFRRKEVLQTFCTCFYGLKDNCFKKTISKEGKAHYTFHVPKNYFSDFSECRTQEEYQRCSKDQLNPFILFHMAGTPFHQLSLMSTKN